MSTLPKTYKAISLAGPDKPWELITVPMRAPAPNEICIRVHASGICLSENFVKEGIWPNMQWPRTPGHEAIGRIAAIGEQLEKSQGRFKIGGLVGVGWNGGYCSTCDLCRIGEFWTCRGGAVTGFTFDGGHAEYMFAPESAIVTIPEEALNNASYAELAPLFCSGVTVFDAIRTTKWAPGDICMVQGIGGLGHLAVQFASKMGLKVYAVSSGSEKRELALSLGAYEYIDYSTTDVVAAMQALGGARVIVCTAPYSEKISSILPAISKNGTAVLLAATIDGDIKVSNLMLNLNRATIRGWCCGASPDSEQCIKFAMISGVKSVVQTFSLEDYPKAFEGLLNNQAKFRNVIVFP